MSECGQCGRNIPFAFGCCFCQDAFCVEHVSPDHHRCSKLRYWPQRKTVKVRKAFTLRKRIFSLLMFTLMFALLSTIVIHMSYPATYPELRHPTYNEAVIFIELDRTEEHHYRNQEYTCAHFAADFKRNALNAGYRCGYVLVLFINWSHALNCFNTTDRGLIFVEPQLDELVTLSRGEPYWDRTKYVPQYGSRVYDDTVVGFLIEW